MIHKDLDTETIRTNIEAFSHFVKERTGKATDDHGWTTRLMFFYLKQARASTIYKNRLEMLYSLSDDQLDNLGCVELEPVDMAEGPALPKSGCTFSRSVMPIPKLIAGEMLSVKLPVDGPNNRSEIEYVSWFDFGDKLNSRIAAQAYLPYYTIKKHAKGDYYFYLYNKKLLKCVELSGIFSDPVEVATFKSFGQLEGGTPDYCNVLDIKFPIQEELKEEMFQRTLASLSNIRSQANPVSDYINDDLDNTGIPPKNSQQQRQ